jgi:hypothetical protein
MKVQISPRKQSKEILILNVIVILFIVMWKVKYIKSS